MWGKRKCAYLSGDGGGGRNIMVEEEERALKSMNRRIQEKAQHMGLVRALQYMMTDTRPAGNPHRVTL